MSRIGKAPVQVPNTVKLQYTGRALLVSGPLGVLNLVIPEGIALDIQPEVLSVRWDENSSASRALFGTIRALIANMVTGVSKGFDRKLTLVGVGYRAQVQGKVVKLSLGFTHPVEYALPDQVKAECPSQTEIILKSPDKILLGRVASEIRAFRPPEPYQGKGVRYADEHVVLKEAKKK